jgi:hypothetical protein
MPGILSIEQRVRIYSGTTPAEVQQAINTDLALTDAWFIRDMGFNAVGAGLAAWVLWERQTRA